MKVLVDTHAVLWWLAGDARLSTRALEILRDPSNQRVVSIAALWEIAIKMSAGRLPADGLTLDEIAEQLRKQEFAFLPIRLEDLFRLEGLEWLHRDPFDRLMIAQAIQEGIPMLTGDSVIERYPVKTLWK
jgi:PIN domain nuclease of toxin-antitoxin system